MFLVQSKTPIMQEKNKAYQQQLKIKYLSISCQGNSVVGATGHLCHSLAKEVCGNQGRGQSMIGGSIA